MRAMLTLPPPLPALCYNATSVVESTLQTSRSGNTSMWSMPALARE